MKNYDGYHYLNQGEQLSTTSEITEETTNLETLSFVKDCYLPSTPWSFIKARRKSLGSIHASCIPQPQMFSVLKLKSPRDLFSSSTQQTFAWSLFKQDWKISLEPVIHLSSNQLIKTKPTPLELRLAVAASSNESQ